jgi:hypothetical protein
LDEDALGEDGTLMDSDGGKKGDDGFECGGVVEMGSEDLVK